LVAATLLLSTLACSKKEDPKPAPTPTAGYTLNNRDVKCNATGVHTITNNTDLLVVTLTTTPQPTSGPEVLTITFTKPTSDPIGNYQTVGSSLTTTTATGPATTIYGTSAGSVRAGSASDKVSGGFATALAAPPLNAITGGYFTDIQH
jgi:hypothetical protein